MNMATLTLQYENLDVTHVRLTAQVHQIKAEFGHATVDYSNGYPTEGFTTIHKQVYKFTKYPELLDIHDGTGWNLEDVLLFVESLEMEVS